MLQGSIPGPLLFSLDIIGTVQCLAILNETGQYLTPPHVLINGTSLSSVIEIVKNFAIPFAPTLNQEPSSLSPEWPDQEDYPFLGQF